MSNYIPLGGNSLVAAALSDLFSNRGLSRRDPFPSLETNKPFTDEELLQAQRRLDGNDKRTTLSDEQKMELNIILYRYYEREVERYY